MANRVGKNFIYRIKIIEPWQKGKGKTFENIER